MRIMLSAAALTVLLTTPALCAKGQVSPMTCDPAPCVAPSSDAAGVIDAEVSARGNLSGISLNTAGVAVGKNGANKPATAPAPAQPPKDEPTPFHPLTDF